jgi:hypothetical protein
VCVKGHCVVGSRLGDLGLLFRPWVDVRCVMIMRDRKNQEEKALFLAPPMFPSLRQYMTCQGVPEVCLLL